MSKTLLFDANNLFLRAAFSPHVAEKSITGDKTIIDYQTWKYTVFNSIYWSLTTLNGASEVVLAVDDRSWRKIVYPVYKANRKKKEDDPIDWAELYGVMDEYISELRECTPFKIVKVQSAEADDVIGVLARHINKHIVIISSDKDYKQLINKNVQMWDPLKKEFIKCSDPNRFIVETCLQGQSKDNILNVLTPLDWDEVNPGKRKPAMGEKKIEKILDEIGLDKWLTDNQAHERFKQNRIVMDLAHTPQVIVNRTLDMYNNYSIPSLDNLMEFFARNNWREFTENYINVERKLQELY